MSLTAPPQVLEVTASAGEVWILLFCCFWMIVVGEAKEEGLGYSLWNSH